MIKLLLLLLIFSFFSNSLRSQNLSAEEIDLYTKECENLVSYFEFTLNSIGTNELTPKEKDVIINESFLKLFRDAKVQVEDDLIADREAVSNKDIQSYLKDVDFFFKDVNFTYNTIAVNLLKNENDQEYFKIQCLRTLNGTNLEGDTVTNKQTRFLEVALNPQIKELKIVSIYTTELNQIEEAVDWWNGLTHQWKDLLGSSYKLDEDICFNRIININPEFLLLDPLNDSTQSDILDLSSCDGLDEYKDIEKLDTLFIENDSIRAFYLKTINHNLNQIMQTEELDLGGIIEIVEIDPLSKLTELKSLNLSGTLVNDLYPIRNLMNLVDLNVSSTLIENLDPLIYSISLQNLDISYTPVYSLASISNLKNIHTLDFSLTLVEDLRPISQFNQLYELKFTNTSVFDLEPIAHLKALKYLYFDNCPINDLSHLSQLNELKIISANSTHVQSIETLKHLNNLNTISFDHTDINDLSALSGKENLRTVYCDNTLLDKNSALEFMSENPNTLVVYESKLLKKWFENLSTEWKNIFKQYVPAINLEEPKKENLHELTGISRIDLSGNTSIKNIDPLKQIVGLKELNVSHTQIESIEVLFELREIEILDASYSSISNIAPLENSSSLNYLDISGTDVVSLAALGEKHSLRKLLINESSVSDIGPIMQLSELRVLEAETTQIKQSQFLEFKSQNSDCLLIYQSAFLQAWWNKLGNEWKKEFTKMMNWSVQPDSAELHELVSSKKVEINGNRAIQSLEPLTSFKLIEELNLNDNQIANIEGVATFKKLIKLELSKNPLLDFQDIAKLSILEWLNISNTQVDDLEFISNLKKLRYLDLSGTQVKKLKALSTLQSLESLNLYNTRINSLKDISDIKSLKSLKIYNTKVSAKKVEQFKSKNPNCEIDYF
jgi:Leucine-rich repeat (LRR) protein